MICKTLFAFCIFTAGVRVHSVPTSASLPVSLPAKITLPTAIWTSSPQSNPAATVSPTSGTHSNSLLPITSLAQTVPPSRNISILSKEEITSPASNWEGTNTDPSPPGFSPTSSSVPSSSTPVEHSSGIPEASVPATGSQSPAESPTHTSPQAPASSPSIPFTSPPEASSAKATTEHSSAVTRTKPTGAPIPPESQAEEHSPGPTPTPRTTAEPVAKETTPQATVPARVTCELIDTETTTASPRVIMQEVAHALSSGSIAAITVTVIAVVLLVFGVAAYLKIRHSSYGRLLDDHDYGSWGNYNNPLYDDS
ncbi:prostate androgen-regulated mucin-like protein 1 [Choloepus didactylus]|uniref:prostate androgen-regulated mucin-like protein 1 n=1 Tax=Choloepus didactylus TaxID=27675 RepID=UPI0018A10437|nr:prostate androgen-regulated mucin-like protein 1 [Choloepus didactylus]